MQLKRVAKDQTLRLPDSVHGPDRLWLHAGGVVDVDDPQVAAAVAGQEYKLEDADPHDEPSPIPQKLAGLFSKLKDTQTAEDAKAARVKVATDKAHESGLASGIQKPDERPRSRRGAGRSEESSAAPSGDATKA
jgi:hypothetical protein